MNSEKKVLILSKFLQPIGKPIIKKFIKEHFVFNTLIICRSYALKHETLFLFVEIKPKEAFNKKI